MRVQRGLTPASSQLASLHPPHPLAPPPHHAPYPYHNQPPHHHLPPPPQQQPYPPSHPHPLPPPPPSVAAALPVSPARSLSNGSTASVSHPPTPLSHGGPPPYQSYASPQPEMSRADEGAQHGKKPKPQPAKVFQCTGYGNCKMVFTRSEHLARHVRKHTGERPFKCHCGKSFSRLDNLRQHASTVHADQPSANDALLKGMSSLHTALAASASQKQYAEAQVVERAEPAGREPAGEVRFHQGVSAPPVGPPPGAPAHQAVAPIPPYEQHPTAYGWAEYAPPQAHLHPQPPPPGAYPSVMGQHHLQPPGYPLHPSHPHHPHHPHLLPPSHLSQPPPLHHAPPHRPSQPLPHHIPPPPPMHHPQQPPPHHPVEDWSQHSSPLHEAAVPAPRPSTADGPRPLLPPLAAIVPPSQPQSSLVNGYEQRPPTKGGSGSFSRPGTSGNGDGGVAGLPPPSFSRPGTAGEYGPPSGQFAAGGGGYYDSSYTFPPAPPGQGYASASQMQPSQLEQPWYRRPSMANLFGSRGSLDASPFGFSLPPEAPSWGPGGSTDDFFTGRKRSLAFGFDEAGPLLPPGSSSGLPPLSSSGNARPFSSGNNLPRPLSSSGPFRPLSSSGGGLFRFEAPGQSDRSSSEQEGMAEEERAPTATSRRQSILDLCGGAPGPRDGERPRTSTGVPEDGGSAESSYSVLPSVAALGGAKRMYSDADAHRPTSSSGRLGLESLVHSGPKPDPEGAWERYEQEDEEHLRPADDHEPHAKRVKLEPSSPPALAADNGLSEDRSTSGSPQTPYGHVGVRHGSALAGVMDGAPNAGAHHAAGANAHQHHHHHHHPHHHPHHHHHSAHEQAQYTPSAYERKVGVL